MAYQFRENNQVWWPVTFTDAADGGSQEYEVEFLVEKLSREELREWTAADLELAGQSDGDRLDVLKKALGPERAQKRERQVLGKIHGWRGFVAEDGETELAFNPAHLKALWRNIPIGNAMERAIKEVAQGGAAKNA